MGNPMFLVRKLKFYSLEIEMPVWSLPPIPDVSLVIFGLTGLTLGLGVLAVFFERRKELKKDKNREPPR